MLGTETGGQAIRVVLLLAGGLIVGPFGCGGAVPNRTSAPTSLETGTTPGEGSRPELHGGRTLSADTASGQVDAGSGVASGTPSSEATEPAGASGTPSAGVATEGSSSAGQEETAAALQQANQPVAVLTAPAVAFVIDYEDSAPSATARTACDADKKGDEEAHQACLQKARERFQADVLRFKRDARSGKHRLMFYKRNGDALREMCVAPVELTEEAPTRVRVRFTGGDRGARPILKGQREFLFTVPTNYAVEIEDPQLGPLHYDAKVGFVMD